MDRIKKCCFIIIYFGQMPNYFSLFLKSCGKNPTFNWLIFTDDEKEFDYPENVQRVLTEFDDIKRKIQSKFEFRISLDQPYKLCDFRPAFGYIFEEYLEEYRYWGYCDNDLIFGDLEQFLPDELMEQYDKLFCLGHTVIFRNTPENNRLFLSENWYKEAFTVPENVIFDECYNNRKNIHDIFLKAGKKVYEKDLSVNFKILSAKFVKITFQSKTRTFESDDRESLYVWDNGKIFRYLMWNGRLQKEEYLYIHLQERKMKYNTKLLSCDIYKIVPNSFLPLEFAQIDENGFPKIKKRAFNLHILQYHCKWKMRKLKRLLKL